jgi:hypothetical protein
MLAHISQYGCTVVQYTKILFLLLVVGGGFVAVATVSFEMAILALMGMFMAVLREHLRGILSRAVYDVPMVWIFQVILFYPLKLRFLRDSIGNGMEWEICGIEWRPLVVYLFLPFLCLGFASWRGLHMACTDEEGVMQCASHVLNM